jgi:hypothetical protein
MEKEKIIKNLTKEEIQLIINEIMKIRYSKQQFINKEDENLLRELNMEFVNRI